MSKSLIIRDGRIIDPSRKLDGVGDLIINDGKLGVTAETAYVLDATGMVVCPGFIDLHCHLRQPGFEEKETIATGSQAAARGGFTTVCCMPNTDPPLDSRAEIDYIKQVAAAEAAVRVMPIGCISKGRKGEKLSEMAELAEAGVIGFSDDGAPVSDSSLMLKAMQYSLSFGLPVMEHCEDTSATADGVVREGFYSTKLGLRGVPSYSEEICLARDLLILRSIPAKYHASHLSSRRSVELIREGKKRGLQVTAETAPHYLCFDDSELERFDTCLRINPPIGEPDDRSALIEALKDGTIDCIASDHAPHAAHEKQVEFEYAPPGAIGLETTFSVIMTHLVKPGHLSLTDALSLITHRPAKIIGIRAGTLGTGEAADLTLFDPDEEWTVETGCFHSKSKNSPWLGKTLTGKVKHTVLDGKVLTASLESSQVGG